MFRLVIGLASFNFVLSAILITNILGFEKNAPPVPVLKLPPVTAEPTPPASFPDGNEEVGKPVIDDEQNEGNYNEMKTLTEAELEAIASGRNPFSASPTVDENMSMQEASYQEKIESIQQKYEQLAKEKELEELAKKNGTLPIIPEPTVPSEEVIVDESNVEKNTKPVGSVLEKSRLEKSEAIVIAKEKAKKYQVPVEWIIAIIEETSNYQTDIVQTKDQMERIGIMYIRNDRAKFIMESLGRYYQPSLVTNATMNMEMGAWYLSYLSKLNSDKEYIFTAYYYGEPYAKTLKSSQGSYRSSFSQNINRRISTVILN